MMETGKSRMQGLVITNRACSKISSTSDLSVQPFWFTRLHMQRRRPHHPHHCQSVSPKRLQPSMQPPRRRQHYRHHGLLVSPEQHYRRHCPRKSIAKETNSLGIAARVFQLRQFMLLRPQQYQHTASHEH